MDETVVYSINNGRYNLMIDRNTIKDNITKHKQYYYSEVNILDDKQLIQFYLARVHEFKIGELIIIKSRNLNIDPILFFRIRKEVHRNNFSWKQWNINSIEDYVDDLIIDYNWFLNVKQRDEYNWNNKRIRSKYYPSSNMLIGYKDLIMYKLCYIHKGLTENNIPKDIRNIICHKYLLEYNEILCRWYYE